MAIPIILFAALAVVGINIQLSVADIRVSISTPVETVTVGGILAIRCQIWNSQDHLTVNIARVMGRRSDKITEQEEVLRSSERPNMFLSTRRFPDGSTVFFLTVVDITEADSGEYQCKVMDFLEGRVVAEDSLNIETYTLPASMYPVCTSTPNAPITLRVHDMLNLKCTSEKGVPTVNVKWINAKSGLQLQSHDVYQNSVVDNEAVIQVDEYFHGSVFICVFTS